MKMVYILSQRRQGDSLRASISSLPFITPHAHSHFQRSVFNDFGPKFTCVDPTGEQPVSGMIASIDKVSHIQRTGIKLKLTFFQDGEGVVTCLEENRHGLEDGDFVTFTEIKGMEELNNSEPIKVTVKGPFTFAIGDTTKFGDYISGGIFTQVKMPKIISFVSNASSVFVTFSQHLV